MPLPHREELEQAHDPAYVGRVRRGELTRQEVRRIGFPWSPELVERSRRSAGATLEACRAALEDGVSVNLAGGTHYAFRAVGERAQKEGGGAAAFSALESGVKSSDPLVRGAAARAGSGAQGS